ncbi:hypothetical protein MSG28_012806, partial [Choristoneura fumiferana]
VHFLFRRIVSDKINKMQRQRLETESLVNVEGAKTLADVVGYDAVHLQKREKLKLLLEQEEEELTQELATKQAMEECVYCTEKDSKIKTHKEEVEKEKEQYERDQERRRQQEMLERRLAYDEQIASANRKRRETLREEREKENRRLERMRKKMEQDHYEELVLANVFNNIQIKGSCTKDSTVFKVHLIDLIIAKKTSPVAEVDRMVRRIKLQRKHQAQCKKRRQRTHITTIKDLGANVTISDMVEDALELISQDGDYMERMGMDIRMQCILCNWAGPKIILEYHIRKEHIDQIDKQEKRDWNITYSLGSLVRQQLWSCRVIEHDAILYTSRVLDSTARYVRFVRKLRALEEEQRKGNETKHKELTDKHSKCVHVLPCIVKLRAKECEEVQLYQMKEKAARRAAEKEFDKMWNARLQTARERDEMIKERKETVARHAAEAKLIGDTWDSLAGQGLAAQLAKEELRKRKE